eukprot:CAMPEP_0204612276 /NCGR_PEP_ID=MMETSP0717-20131115/372_1 /ASSEMBLY_ACC=CAM_ASM_000666 /TAXON_ID=230516 /ORGANISM="Chaetoceros curvisetus" /LENGTH=244 /DNA_ID=CAMNT_0051624295 /DNA_START=252 /DNA_END=986 /DNA_ORIENTATION=-
MPGIRQTKNVLKTVAKAHSIENDLSPIIWDIYDLKSTLASVLEGEISWDAKLDKAVWRGTLSGDIDRSDEKSANFEGNCNRNQRCQLVLNSVDSSYIDAGVSMQRSDLPIGLDYIHLLKGPLSIEEQLKYKIVIVVEGENFSYSLAWALYSGSVVIMPRPTKTSYLMEERLEPWIHYVAVKDDWSNLEKKVKWCINNSDKAKKIAERGSLWVHDLYMDEGAEVENKEIGKEMLKRYLEFFIKDG